MQTQIQKWGNSLGIRIPKKIANKLSLTKNVIVKLEIKNNHLIISREVTTLANLLNNVTDDNCHHELLSDDDTVGNEIW